MLCSVVGVIDRYSVEDGVCERGLQTKECGLWKLGVGKETDSPSPDLSVL